MASLPLLAGLLTLLGVGGEFERVLEVDMYGSRPVDRSRVGDGSNYYKYQELSEAEHQDLASPGDHTHQAELGPGPGGALTTADTATHQLDQPAPGAGHSRRVSGGQAWDRAGSCLHCSTLSDTTGLCQDIGRYLYEKKLNNSDLPQFESQCTQTEKYCQVRRVEYKVDDMQGYAQWSLERACVKQCDPFCVSMGGRTKVTYCTSCCRWDGLVKDEKGMWSAGPRQDFCNTDSHGAALRGRLLAAETVLVILLSLINV